MSDFVSSFWHYYVFGLVVLSLVFCVWILGSNMSSGKKTGPAELQEHVWDEDLQEYNNPLPRWWMLLFWATLIFAVGYLVVFPGLGSYPGVWKWTSANQYQGESKDVDNIANPIFEKYAKMDLLEVAKDKEAIAIGQRLFLNSCAQCHGADGGGQKGYPKLTDNVWLWGGSPERVVETITNGRNNAMTAFKTMLTADQIKDLAAYVRSLSGLSSGAEEVVAAERGRVLYTDHAKNPAVICWTCHGNEGKGNQAIGVPNLTDKDWLYGFSETTVAETITGGRVNQMPAFKDTLGEKRIHLLAAYVLSLSQGAEAQK